MSNEQVYARIAARVEAVRRRIAEACAAAGRAPEEVTLTAVTKTVGVEEIRALLAAGVKDVAENRVQVAAPKFEELAVDFKRAGAVRHFIGHLQTNKINKALRLFSFFHSVDSFRLLETLPSRLSALRQAADGAGNAPAPVPLPCLAEVNISGEQQKHGLRPAELPEFLMRAAESPTLKVEGLMTMAPLTAESEKARSVFRGLRELLEEANVKNWYPTPLPELSMGMSRDYPAAVEEGATLVRIGRALFSD